MRDQRMESYFNNWIKQEEVAESMIPLVGKLYRDYGVVTTIYVRRCDPISPAPGRSWSSWCESHRSALSVSTRQRCERPPKSSPI